MTGEWTGSERKGNQFKHRFQCGRESDTETEETDSMKSLNSGLVIQCTDERDCPKANGERGEQKLEGNTERCAEDLRDQQTTEELRA